MMHRPGFYRILLLALLSGWAALRLPAQINVSISAGGKPYSGTLSGKLQLGGTPLGNPAQISWPLSSPQKLRVTLSGLAWSPDTLSARIVVKAEELESPAGLRLTTVRDVFLKSGQTRYFEYEIIGPGSGTLEIPLLGQMGETGPMSRAGVIRLPYQIQAAGGSASSEEDDWVAAVDQNTIAAFESFLKKHPGSSHRSDAERQIKELKGASGSSQGQPRAADPKPEKPASADAAARESKLWDQIRRSGNVEDMKEYLNLFPKGPHKDEVEERLERALPMEAKVNRSRSNRNRFVITLKYAAAPVSYQFSDTSGYTYEWQEQNSRMEVEMLEPKTLRVEFADANGKTKGVDLNADLDPLEIVSASFVKDSTWTTGLQLSLNGGKPPYTLVLSQFGVEGVAYEYPLGTEKAYELNLEEIADAIAAGIPGRTTPISGRFELSVIDQRKTESVAIGENALLRSTRKTNFLPWIIAGAVLLALAVGAYAWNAARKQRLKREIEARRQKAQERGTQQVQERPAAVQPPAAPPPPGTSKFAISRKVAPDADTSSSGEGPSPAGKEEDYCRLPLTTLWADTAITDVMLHRKCIGELDAFIRELNINPWKEDNQEAIPEIGGFLLGFHQPHPETGRYRVYIEEFVPITPEEHGVYKIEFGVMAWAELADVQDNFPNLETIGWFHTHPGHGLFLSQPDLRIHEGFFRQPFQVAMEIDTLSPNLDTAFFTRSQSGAINNTHLRVADGWFRWYDIQTFA